MKKSLSLLFGALCTFSAGAQGLKDVYQDAFLIGTIASNQQLMKPDADTSALFQREFNVLTAENDMKWQRIYPSPQGYNFAAADALMQQAEDCQCQVVGHTLIWHQQTPDWVFEDDAGNPVSREVLLGRMQSHINTLMTRYQDDVYGWDVVNEALNEDGTLRESRWREIIGDDYIAQAFRFATEANPNAELYYNDYNLNAPAKRDGAVRLVKSLLAQGVKVSGIGMQAHYMLRSPAISQIEESITAFASLGVKVMITELDISVLPFPKQAAIGAEISETAAFAEALNPYADGLPTDVQDALATRYRELFALFYKHRDDISRVTFWGTHDGTSWKNNWPVRGRTDYPLLIDRQGQPKPAYEAVATLPASIAQ
ncbi:endo-1,4-beta-xylanase [Alteromonas antoniana]|uniref:endo-1,4-beta-xylanase n=1 Tax=Alteromonas antoniana TaxID=2803813 RepID=UPI001FE9A79A|nr:endo-1,4-beta-xylanase [Alteromonas antoniana]